MDSSSATETFDERFLKLYTDLTSTYIALVWEEELAQNSPAEWLEIVKSFTLPAVIEFLGHDKPPTFDELLDLPWIDTDDPGAYLHLLSPQTAGHHNHLYGGSATGAQAGSKAGSKGLRARRDGGMCLWTVVWWLVFHTIHHAHNPPGGLRCVTPLCSITLCFANQQ